MLEQSSWFSVKSGKRKVQLTPHSKSKVCFSVWNLDVSLKHQCGVFLKSWVPRVPPNHPTLDLSRLAFAAKAKWDLRPEHRQRCALFVWVPRREKLSAGNRDCLTVWISPVTIEYQMINMINVSQQVIQYVYVYQSISDIYIKFHIDQYNFNLSEYIRYIHIMINRINWKTCFPTWF